MTAAGAPRQTPPVSAPRTLTELFLRTVDAHRARPDALVHLQDGTWMPLSYAEVYRRVRALSRALRRLGLRPGDRAAIISGNRPEWMITDHACLTARCAGVAIYPTLPATQAAYILRDSGAVAAFVENAEQLAKIRAERASLPALRHVIAFDPTLAGDDVHALDALIAEGDVGAEADDAAWRAEALGARPEDLATLIYTSGTTGDPKGVMLSHGNFTSNAIAGLTVLRVRDDDEYLSFLPLSHVFERMLHYTIFLAGATISYARSIDTVAQDMLARRPTVVASVPRLYEKIHARVVENAQRSGLSRAIFGWALAQGRIWSELTVAGRTIPAGTALKHRIADRLVFRKLRARTGGRIRFFISGGAPLGGELARFFHAAGLPILEGYGLTETSPVISVNSFDALRLGSVGRPLPGVEVKIAADGEVLTRGPHVMQGYWGKPDATAEVIDADGWFHTGDIGELDADGYLRITDRKKDLIVTAGGKNIAPQPIEGRVKRSPYVANAVMLGDRRRFPILLVVPNVERLQAWARHQQLPQATDLEALLESPEAAAKMEQEVAKVVGELAQFERPKKLLLLAEDFSLERGELTPTLKVRRRIVEERWRERIDALYGDPPPVG
jgi:long-chain acyl-CoA synthetase